MLNRGKDATDHAEMAREAIEDNPALFAALAQKELDGVWSLFDILDICLTEAVGTLATSKETWTILRVQHGTWNVSYSVGNLKIRFRIRLHAGRGFSIRRRMRREDRIQYACTVVACLRILREWAADWEDIPRPLFLETMALFREGADE